MRTLIERSRDGADAAHGPESRRGAAGSEPGRAYEVALVLSDQPGAAGLVTAHQLGVPTQEVIAHKGLDRASYGRLLAVALDACAPSLIVLAGFMRILSAEFVDRYAGRLMNIHPSLLPKYPGLHTHRRVLDAAEPCHGATVHFVTAELDAGPRILQGILRVRPGEDEPTLTARVHTLEHAIYPRAVRWYCEGRLCCRAGQVWLDGKRLAEPVIYDPSLAHDAVTAGRPGRGR